jgi:hypothetical protein
MDRFCDEVLPDMLGEVCGVARQESEAVARDILTRARAMARLDRDTQRLLAAPFFEESCFHDPREASSWLKAITTVVVRNSLLEAQHASGQVNQGGIRAITTTAAAPLSHLLATAIDKGDGPSLFTGLADRYPRAWACLDALRNVLVNREARAPYRATGPRPTMPHDDELVVVKERTLGASTSGAPAHVVLSGVDPRIDQNLAAVLRQADSDPGFVLAITALSRISRNEEKLLRVLEFLLSRGNRVLTSNHLLTASAVYCRTSQFVRPNSEDVLDGLKDLSGISGVHRKTVISSLRQFAPD